MPTEPIRPGIPLDMVSVAVVVDRPSSEDLAGHSRAEKYLALRKNASGVRDRLIDWISEQGLAAEVYQVGQPTAFNLLFVVATPGVAERLAQAPGVISVTPSQDFGVDLPHPDGQTLLHSRDASG